MDTDQTLTAANVSTCKKKREPWPHECPDCGKEIMSACYGRVFCPECKAKARKATIRKYEATEKAKANHCKSSRRWREKYPERSREAIRKYREEHRDEICQKMREKYWADPEPQRLKSKLRQRRLRGDGKADFELRRLTGKVQTCPRMHVTMVQLPCGKRPECWNGKPCEKTEGKSKPRALGPQMWAI